MQDQSNGVSFSPSFSCYSADQVSDAAARVADEERASSSGCGLGETGVHSSNVDRNAIGEVDDDFEFVLVRARPGDESVADGGVESPVYPLFNRDLLLDRVGSRSNGDRDVTESIRLPLKKLFVEDRDPPSSSSSSEADELEATPPGTYCVWTPKSSMSPSPSPGRCNKSNSTGSSSKPRWWLRDLLRRCSSDGKHSLVFLNPNTSSVSASSSRSSSSSSESYFGKKRDEQKVERGKIPPAAAAAGKVSAHEAFYVRNKAMKDGDKRKSYLPYKQDLVGFFRNANLGRTFPPF